MNIEQKQIAVAIGRHFKRQNEATPRNGPLNRVREDQDTFLYELNTLFSQKQPAFDVTAFIAVVHEHTA